MKITLVYIFIFIFPTIMNLFFFKYLQLARELPGYGDIVFPHCSCDSRKDGHVIAAVGMRSFRLHACREDGSLESQVVEFEWSSIKEWEADDEAVAFCFQYQKPDKNPRWVKIFTPYVSLKFV